MRPKHVHEFKQKMLHETLNKSSFIKLRAKNKIWHKNSLILRDFMFKKNKITIPQFEQQSPQHELNISQLEKAFTLYEWRFRQCEHKFPHFEGSIIQKEQKYNPSIWATKSSMWTKYLSTWGSLNSLWVKIFPQIWLWYVPRIEWWPTQNRTNHPGSALIVPHVEANEGNFHNSVLFDIWVQKGSQLEFAFYYLKASKC